MNKSDKQVESYSDIPERDDWEITEGSIWIDIDGFKIPFAKSDEVMIQLTNREFKELDEAVNYKFLALIIKKIKENPGRQIVILDIGGGIYSKAARGILKHPMLKDRVKCINVDLFAKEPTKEELEKEGLNPNNLTVINSDFAQSGLPDDSVDAVISWQALNYMDDQKFFEAITEIARILRPGGEAYMDIEGPYIRTERVRELFGFPSMEEFMAQRWRIALQEKDVFFWQTLREMSLNGTCHTMGGGNSMLYMCKSKTNREMPQMNNFNLAFPEIREAVQRYE